MNENSLIFMEKSGVFSKKSADMTEGQPSFQGRIFGGRMFPDKFCFEVCGMTHIRTKRKDYPDRAVIMPMTAGCRHTLLI